MEDVMDKTRVREVAKRRIQAHIDANVLDSEEITKEIFDIIWNNGFTTAVQGEKK
jgi:hypothetical protein